MRYKLEKAGQWIQPKRKYYYVQCCDCSLSHKVQFRLVDYGNSNKNHKHKIQFRVWRINKRSIR